jgi:hypothetical protein
MLDREAASFDCSLRERSEPAPAQAGDEAVSFVPSTTHLILSRVDAKRRRVSKDAKCLMQPEP